MSYKIEANSSVSVEPEIFKEGLKVLQCVSTVGYRLNFEITEYLFESVNTVKEMFVNEGFEN